VENNLKDNFLKVEFSSIAENVGLARIIVAGFIAPLDPTVDEISDIKTAVSEAVTNAIIHGYDGSDGSDTEDTVKLKISNIGRDITIEVTDSGVGIDNIDQVREPMFTTKPEMERSGLGFTVMESFMDSIVVKSAPGEGTTVILAKNLSLEAQA